MKHMLLTALATMLLTTAVIVSGAAYWFGTTLIDMTLRRGDDGQPPTVYRVIIEGSGRKIKTAPKPTFDSAQWSSASFDGLTLRATHFTPDEDAKHRWAIIAHGYGLSQEYIWNFADAYLQHGYEVLTPDLRASGTSDGRYLTMGALDKLDLGLWIALIRQRDPQAKIVLHGMSLGATTMLLTATQSPPGVVAVVADSAYTTLRDIMTLELRRLFNASETSAAIESALRLADLACRHRAGFAFADADSLAAVRSLSLPVLFVHSDADQLVPPMMSDELYAACASTAKARLVTHGYSHAVSFQDPQYFRRVFAFVDRHTR